MLRVFQHHVEQASLADGFVIGAGSLHHMSRAVKLVSLQQICPALILILYREICVEITVLVLRGGYFFYKIIDFFFKLRVGKIVQGIRRRLYPFGSVAVLKDHSVEAVSRVLTAYRFSRVDKILYHMAFFRSLRLVGENAVLIGYNGVSYELLIPSYKAVGYIRLLRYLFLDLHYLYRLPRAACYIENAD